MVCYELDRFYKWNFTDHCTDHRFFCGQFFIWSAECQTVREDHTGHESCHESSSGGWYLGRQYNRRFFPQSFCPECRSPGPYRYGRIPDVPFLSSGKGPGRTVGWRTGLFSGNPSGCSSFSGWGGSRDRDRTGTGQGRLFDTGSFSGRSPYDEGRLGSRKSFSGFFSEGYFLGQRYLSDGSGSGNFM